MGLMPAFIPEGVPKGVEWDCPPCCCCLLVLLLLKQPDRLLADWPLAEGRLWGWYLKSDGTLRGNKVSEYSFRIGA